MFVEKCNDVSWDVEKCNDVSRDYTDVTASAWWCHVLEVKLFRVLCCHVDGMS